MPEDRLRRDTDEVHQLEDMIDARDHGTSHIARDVDAFDEDLEIPEDIDVDEALTFPHPKHKKDPNADIELMSTPQKDDLDIDWAEHQDDMLPSDYKDDYDDALTTDLADEDEIAEENIAELGDVTTGDAINGVPIVTRMPKGFSPEEETGE